MRRYEVFLQDVGEGLDDLSSSLRGLNISPEDGAEIERLLGIIESISTEILERRVAHANTRKAVNERQNTLGRATDENFVAGYPGN